MTSTHAKERIESSLFARSQGSPSLRRKARLAVGQLLDGAARLVGLRLIPSWRLEQWAFAEHLRTLFAAQSISTVIDVGANLGQYRDFLRQQVGFQGMIHSFEPIRSLADQMRARSSNDPRWQVHSFALGREEGQASINVMASSTFSSLRTVSATAPSGFLASAQVARTESIQVLTLDLACERYGINPEGAYLKLDTQGYDLEVISGAAYATQVLASLQIELAIQRIYDGIPTYREILAHLESLEFAISGVFPISRDSEFRAVELDCVFVRNRKIPTAE